MIVCPIFSHFCLPLLGVKDHVETYMFHLIYIYLHLIYIYLGYTNIQMHMGLDATRENLSPGVRELQSRRPAYAFAQSDQCLCYSLGI